MLHPRGEPRMEPVLPDYQACINRHRPGQLSAIARESR
jgi:hypothetical protein